MSERFEIGLVRTTDQYLVCIVTAEDYDAAYALAEALATQASTDPRGAARQVKARWEPAQTSVSVREVIHLDVD
jgi:hypothetical protein